MVQKQNENNVNDEIDFIRLVKVLVKRKWLFMGLTLAITLAALIISLLLPKSYQSTAFFRLSSGADINLEELKQIQDRLRNNLVNDLLYNLTLAIILEDNFADIEMMMRNMSFPDYKKYSAQFSNPYRFSLFLKEKQQAGDKDALELKNSNRPVGSLGQCIEPVYAYTKKDLKELTQNPREARNFILGVQLKAEKETPGKAQAFVSTLGEFIRDSILLGKLRDYINTQWHKALEESRKFDNLTIKDQFKLQQLTAKRNDMEYLLKKYPEAQGMTATAGHNSYGYLLPSAQVVNIESSIADIKENISINEREKELMDLKFAFFTKIKEMMTNENEMSGYNSLITIMKTLDLYFAEKKLPEHTVRQVKNELGIDFAKLMTVYEEMQFLSGPTLSHTPVKPKKNLIVAVGFVLGLLLSIFLVFAMDWWAMNKLK